MQVTMAGLRLVPTGENGLTWRLYNDAGTNTNAAWDVALAAIERGFWIDWDEGPWWDGVEDAGYFDCIPRVE